MMQPAFALYKLLILVDLVELAKQLGIFWNSLVILLGESNGSLFVDNEHRTLRHPLRPQAIILSTDGAMRPEIR